MINNIFWVNNLNVIGGVETFMYELAKIVKDYDFVIYYNRIAPEHLKRLKKYVRCVKYNGEKLKCKKLFMNYDISIIDNVEAEEYIEIIHAVFKYCPAKPHTHDKITQYYAVSKEACESFKEITGKECEVLYNPIQIEKPKKVLRLISATRLAIDKGKICQKMQKLVNILEANNIPYEWKIFTNGQHIINGKNVIYMQPTLDIRDYIADADYLVQLSDTEAFCYSVLEALHLNKPVIVTPIPCFEEMGVKTGKNGYILDFDMKNVPILDIYNKIPTFTYQPLKNNWLDKIVKVKGNYKEEKEMKVKVKVLYNFNDLECNVKRKVGETFICKKERAEYLESKKAVEILEIIEELKTEIIVDKQDGKVGDLKPEVEKAIKKVNKPKTTKKITKKIEKK